MLTLLARYRRLLTIAACILAVLLPILLGILFFVADAGTGIKSATVNVQTGKTPSVFSPSTKQHFTYSSDTIKSRFEFDAIAPHWQEQNANDTNRTVSVRTSPNGRDWSGWMKLEVMRPQKDGAPHEDEVFPETPLISIGNYFQYKVDLTASPSSGSTPSIRNLNITYIDSRPSVQQQVKDVLRQAFSTKVGATSAVPQVISRADWGNPDPTGNAFKGSDQYWPPTYKQVSQVFIHHTVDSNYSSWVDGASVVRAIWQYHTYTLGWGDIGYNYLVDQAGNIYQGRAHGDNVVGGHVYGYNPGSMGVALIGCFQPDDSACQQLNSGGNPPSPQMLDKLTDLLAWKMTTYAIDPQATHTFCKGDGTSCLNLYTISGHRDAYPTSCPGDLAYQQLQSIRYSTASKMNNKYTYAAEQYDFPYVNFGDNNEVSVTMKFTNVGTATWYNSGSSPIRLATANPDDHTSAFKGSTWINDNRAATLNEPSVAPGHVGSFTFTLDDPPGFTGYAMEYFHLVAEGTASFGNFFGLPIVTRVYSFSYNTQNAYTDSSKTAQASLDSMSPGQSAWFTLQLTNTGNTTWYNSGANPTRLATYDSPNRISGLCATGWINCDRPAVLQESSVTPGSTGTFEFPVHITSQNGLYRESFIPVAEGLSWMGGPTVYWDVAIHGIYNWSFISQNAYTDSTKTTPVNLDDLSPGQTIFFSVTAKNTGDTVWYNSGTYPVDLGTSYPFDRASLFYNSAWISQNRTARLKESSVAPGQTGTFEATYTIPSGGLYKEHMQPVAEGVTWLNDVGLYLPASVNSNYSWALTGQQAYTDSSMSVPVNTGALTVGERFYYVVSAKNTGNTTWYNSSNYPLHLGTSQPFDRESALYDSSWPTPTRSAMLTEVSVAPGQIGHFAAYYTAPDNPGSYTEHFQPVAESLTWLNDAGLSIPLTVQ